MHELPPELAFDRDLPEWDGWLFFELDGRWFGAEEAAIERLRGMLAAYRRGSPKWWWLTSDDAQSIWERLR